MSKSVEGDFLRGAQRAITGSRYPRIVHWSTALAQDLLEYCTVLRGCYQSRRGAHRTVQRKCNHNLQQHSSLAQDLLEHRTDLPRYCQSRRGAHRIVRRMCGYYLQPQPSLALDLLVHCIDLESCRQSRFRKSSAILNFYEHV